MPWKETDAMKERVKFVLEWEKRWNEGEGRLNFAELCREFGISRQVGYVWLRRYRQAKQDLSALKERARRPLTSPTKLAEAMEDLLVAARKRHPTWGPKKLRAWLAHYRLQLELPAQSTIGTVLRRRGLTTPRSRRLRATKAATQPFADITGPNATWCVDFKGHFRTHDGNKCYPLTINDAHSRFLIRCEVVESPDGTAVQQVFDSAFSEFGLPAAIRSDNGPPFASVGAGGLTKLSVWWLRPRLAPPYPPSSALFDLFRREYNDERPHEALGQRPPASAFALSQRRYPRPMLRFQVDAPWHQAARVDRDGFIRWDGKPLFISTALAHDDIELRYESDLEQWQVVFGPLSLGWIRQTPALRFTPTKGRMADHVERQAFERLSAMSSD
ncbi:MAG: DDE-type integrase/transposase/recombinase [Deltaproteobacteria bacterium]